MKLRNRFDDADKQRMWQYHPYCVVCKSSQNCSVHHIDGCKEPMHRSLLNSIMLCHRHHKEADSFNVGGLFGKGMELREKYRLIALDQFIKEDLTIHDYDRAYFAKYHTGGSKLAVLFSQE